MWPLTIGIALGLIFPDSLKMAATASAVAFLLLVCLYPTLVCSPAHSNRWQCRARTSFNFCWRYSSNLPPDGTVK